MDPISVLAASGIQSRLESLDLLANNLANAATNGYKGDREFYSLFASSAARPDALGNIATMPMIDSHWTDFSQGTLEATNNPLDFALSGNGFFAVNGPSGPLYTRNGSFQLSSTGTLITSDGYAVRSRDGKPITADPALSIEVTPQGSVQQGGASIGELELVKFPSTALLAKQGNNYFRNMDAKVNPSPAMNAEVHQGKVETSNVKAPEAAVQLVGVMRQFEMLQKAITLSIDMNKKAVEEVARVGS